MNISLGIVIVSLVVQPFIQPPLEVIPTKLPVERIELPDMKPYKPAKEVSAPKPLYGTKNVKTSSTGRVRVSGDKKDWMRAAGIPTNVWSCVDALVQRESGWRVNADNPTSSAYGLPQALPGNKMSSHGSDWATNPVTQLKWMRDYTKNRYGGWCQANSFQLRNSWY